MYDLGLPVEWVMALLGLHHGSPPSFTESHILPSSFQMLIPNL